MYGILDISASGLMVQRDRLTTIASNLANRDSIAADGTPYRAKRIFFAPGDPSARSPQGRKWGVHVASVQDDDSDFGKHYDPTDPRAMKSGPLQGYVLTSNVNPVNEQVNALQASRAYEANVVAAEATKSMMAQALRLLA